MARPTVPHCTDCKHYRDLRHYRDRKGLHVCFYYGSNYERRKIISGQEIRTCPLWCPLRLAGFKSAY